MDHGTSTLDIVLSNQVARFILIQPGNKDTHLETKPEELKELLDIWLKKSHKASFKKWEAKLKMLWEFPIISLKKLERDTPPGAATLNALENIPEASAL